MERKEEQEEQEVIQRWKSGDSTAFTAIFNKHYKMLCRSAYFVLGDHYIAEDVVQEFFISFWNKRQSINISTNLKGYLRRAVINRSINYLKSPAGRVKFEELNHTAESKQSAVDQSLERADQRRALKRCIDKLPEKRRLVFTLRRYEELSYKEIADNLKITVKTVEVQLRNARIALRDCLKPILNENYTFE